MRWVLISFICLCFLTASVVGQSFLEQLKVLPSIPKTVGTTLWGWGGRSGWDNTNLEHLEWARVAGGVIAWDLQLSIVEQGAKVAKASGAKFALRVHPYYKYEYSPTYKGPALRLELENVSETLRKARIAAGLVPIEYVFIDSETFTRDPLGDYDKQVWNNAIRCRHNEIINIIRKELGPKVFIEFYACSPSWRSLSLSEQLIASSASMYFPLDRTKQKKFLNQALDFAYSRNFESVTIYISLGSGYGSSGWNWKLDPPMGTTEWLGYWLRNTFRVHNIIDYTSFDDRGIHWEKHTIPFLKKLLNVNP